MNFIPNDLSVRSLWRSVPKNLSLKIISFFSALILFLLVRSQQVKEIPKQAKLVIATAANVMVVGAKERAVDVTVRLPEVTFSRQASDEELIGRLDMTNEKTGKVRIRLSRDNFPLLDKRYQLTIHEPWIEVELDTVDKKYVAVRAVLQGSPKNGLTVDAIKVTPEVVQVTGPKKALSSIDSLSTSAINIDGIDKNFSTLTNVFQDENSSLATVEEKINVQVIVGAQKVSHIFHGIPIEIQGNSGLAASPSNAQIEVRATQKRLDNLKAVDIKAYLDSVLLGPTPKTEKIMVKVPPGIEVVNVIPDSVFIQPKK